MRPAVRVLLAGVSGLVGGLPGPLAAHGQEAAPLDPGVVAELEARARTLVDSVPLPGLAVAIVIRGRTVYSRGFGVADRVRGDPVTPGTLFQIGSVTKAFTATLLGLAVERGRVELTDPLSGHLPADVRSPAPGITLEHLATHTAGLPADPPTLRRKHGDYPILAFTHFELYRSLEATEPVFPPGTDWAYSNFGYAVLGHALERVAGVPFETLLAEEVFSPLGMTSSTVTLWPELSDRLATPYYPDGETGELEEYTPWDEEALAPAGGIASSAEDVARFISAHLTRSKGGAGLLSDGTLEELGATRWRLSDSRGYGLGWFVLDVEGVGRVLSHGGEVDGYSAVLEIAPDRSAGVVLLTNVGDAAILLELSRWILGRVGADGEP